MTNTKSDLKAKTSFASELARRGFSDVNIISQPADISAVKDGAQWYFEIKMTKKTGIYFGAATLTEWGQALKDPEHFRFVVAMTDDKEEEFAFKEYTPQEFMDFSSIPPFKVYFNIDLSGKRRKRKSSKEGRAAAKMSGENFKVIQEAFCKLLRG